MKLNYSIRRCTRATARIAIESHQDLDPTTKPEIWRFSPSGWSLISKLDEAVIGRSEGQTCAFVCRVRQHDVIGTREVFSSGETLWSYYRIDTSFRPVSLAGDARHPSWLNQDVLLPVNYPSPLPDDSDEREIRRFFSQKHPAWLQDIVDRQIEQWRESKPDRFFRFAPTALSERGLERCVKEAPFAALARFKGLLNDSQIRECVIRSPRGAVIYALEHVTDRFRKRYLIEHVSEALLHSHNKLSDAELAECAWIDMETGYHLRDRLPPHRRAIALAKSYPFNFLKTAAEMEEVHREISESMFSFPDQWEASERGGFPAVFEYLENRIGWRFDPLLFADLLKRDGSRKPAAFERFLAGMI